MRAAPPLVLVHGAFQTAGTWDLVVPRLEQAGRRVVVAALSGLEDTGEELTDAITLDTHVRDVLTVLHGENLEGATLAGHSYAGMVITGVAEHAHDRISHLVYVDAFVPTHGQSALDLMPAPTREAFRTMAEHGGGWRLRSSDSLLDLWGLDDGAARTFVQKRLCDFTIRCFDQPLDAPRRAGERLRRSYIASVKQGYPARAVFEPFAVRAQQEGWGYGELPCGHDAQAEMPGAFCDLLLRLTAES